ncbi:MAG: protein-S-isoprenylcysteine O-methyltransferase [Cyanobacteria bacterium P01_C01_bin.89]
MEPLILKVIFLIFSAFSFVIRNPYQKKIKQNDIVDDRQTRLESGLLSFVFLGAFIVPLVYVFTPFLNFANYVLPVWANVLGMVIFALGMYLFWRSHHDLDRNWSPTLKVRADHTLVTNGIYQKIRHPMYTSIWLWGLGQALLLTNWIAGLSGLVSFGTLYFLRVNQEERMMVEKFGDQYQAYKHRTKRLVPYLF